MFNLTMKNIHHRDRKYLDNNKCTTQLHALMIHTTTNTCYYANTRLINMINIHHRDGEYLNNSKCTIQLHALMILIATNVCNYTNIRLININNN